MSLAKDRLYRRIEKVLITIESIIIGAAAGFVWSQIWNKWYVFTIPWLEPALVGFIVFMAVISYKRWYIKMER